MRSLLAYLNIGIRLYQLHLVHAVEDQIADSVDAVAAVLLDAACIDVGKVGVCTALLERDAYLNRRRLVVELDPEALQKLKSSLIIEYAVLYFFCIVRLEMLVDPARAECVPRIELGCDCKVSEPVELDRLPVCLRRMGRNDVEICCHLLKLSLTYRVLAILRFFLQ